MDEFLTWDDHYAIGHLLSKHFPDVDWEKVSLNDILRWSLSLPGFIDEAELTNDEILMAIYQDWYEEANVK